MKFGLDSAWGRHESRRTEKLRRVALTPDALKIQGVSPWLKT